MHRSGISVSAELSQAFNNSDSTGKGLFHIQLRDEAFTIVADQPAAADHKSAFDAARAILSADPDSPAYIPVRPAGAEKWVIIHFMPDEAQVRQKMLYASSRSSLKDGLGGSKFDTDFFCSTVSECTHEAYLHSKEVGNTEELMTYEERMHAEARVDSHMSAGTVKLAAMGDIPLNVEESVTQNVQAYSSGSTNCVYMSLDMKTEVLTARPASSDMKSLDEIHAQLPPKDGMYVLFKYNHTHDGAATAATIFLYYCPDLAAPKNKMFYSSTKANVLKVLEKSGVQVTKSIEISEPKELSDAFVKTELYPQETVKKSFAKPGARGKGKRRLHRAFQS